MKLRSCILWAVLLLPITLSGFQKEGKKAYLIRTIAFYNMENLFDTKNDSLIFDDARTPDGADRWTYEKYLGKIGKLSRVISLIGKELRGSPPDIIGLCELENRQVLQDLFSHKSLAHVDYGLVHFNSPDERGIDVALVYRKSSFVPFTQKSQRLLLQDVDGNRDYTRDLLIVGGMLDNTEVFILVNHWPSRSGGEIRSRVNRLEAALLNRRMIDSLKRVNPDTRIIIMGDLNDNPTDISLRKVLRSRGEKSSLGEDDLYNPMENLYKKGIGSLGYRDQWHLFDQILISPKLLSPHERTYRFWKAGVFNPSFLITREGRYKGYPYRTYAGGSYQGGYSDHFPVYMYLVRKVE